MRTGYMSQRVVKDVGNYIGEFIESDANNFVGVWREYLRVRVSISLSVPLKRRMKLRRSEEQWCWVNFKYEGIPTFCFICGMIGHAEKYCEKLFDTPLEHIEKPYGVWMRAEPRRKTHTMGSKWLRPGGFSPTSISEMEGDAGEGSGGSVKGGEIILGGVNLGGVGNSGTKIVEAVKGGNQVSKVGANIQASFQNYSLSTEAGKGENTENTELVVMDPKRRRTEKPIDMEIRNSMGQPIDCEMSLQNIEERNQKNELLAGVAMQPRQSL